MKCASLPVTRVDPIAYWPFYLGTLRDCSGKGNHITGVEPPIHWNRCGQTDCLSPNRGWVQISPNPSLTGLTKMSFFLALDGRSHIGNEYIVRTLTGFPWFYTYGTATPGFFLYDGTDFSSGPANLIGATSCGFSIDVGPAKPKFYTSGQLASTGTTDLTLNTVSATWRIGATNAPNFLRSPFSLCAIYPDVLTDDEFAALDAYALEQRTPHKLWPGAGLRYPREPEQLLTDGSMEAPTTDAWDALVGAILTKPTDDPYEGQRSLQIDWSTGTGPIARQQILTVGEYYRAMWASKSDGTYTPRVSDGAVILWTGDTSTAWSTHEIQFQAQGQFFSLFSNASAAGYVRFDDVRVTRVYQPYVPADGEPLFLDNIQSARVSLRTEGGTSTYNHISNTSYLTTDATSEWRVNEDATGRRLENVTAGVMHRRNQYTDGTWYLGWNKGGDANTFATMLTATEPGAFNGIGQDGYLFLADATEALSLVRIDSGFPATLWQTAAGYVDASTDYEVRCYRDESNEWTAWIRGGAFSGWTLIVVSSGSNPITDGTHMTSEYTTFDLDAGGYIKLDQHYKGLV